MTADPRGQKALSVRWENGGRALDEVGLAMEGHRNLAVTLLGVSIRAALVPGGEYLITLKGEDEAGLPVVSFHASADLLDGIRGVSARLLNGTLRWREDEFRR